MSEYFVVDDSPLTDYPSYSPFPVYSQRDYYPGGYPTIDDDQEVQRRNKEKQMMAKHTQELQSLQQRYESELSKINDKNSDLEKQVDYFQKLSNEKSACKSNIDHVSQCPVCSSYVGYKYRYYVIIIVILITIIIVLIIRMRSKRD